MRLRSWVAVGLAISSFIGAATSQAASISFGFDATVVVDTRPQHLSQGSLLAGRVTFDPNAGSQGNEFGGVYLDAEMRLSAGGVDYLFPGLIVTGLQSWTFMTDNSPFPDLGTVDVEFSNEVFPSIALPLDPALLNDQSRLDYPNSILLIQAASGVIDARIGAFSLLPESRIASNTCLALVALAAARIQSVLRAKELR